MMSNIAVNYVYFIEARGLQMVKIGRSGDVARRMKEVARLSPVPLRLLVGIPGGSDVETKIHHRFSDAHSHGEWYFATPSLRKYVADLVRLQANDRNILMVLGLARILTAAAYEWRRTAAQSNGDQ